MAARETVVQSTGIVSQDSCGRFPGPPVVAGTARLQKAGLEDVAWIYERLHADALLAPLAEDDTKWKTLGHVFVYNSRKVQTQTQKNNVSDVGVRWIALRVLQRGRYNRLAALKDGGQWDSLRASVRLCKLPVQGQAPPSKEWYRKQDRRRGHSSVGDDAQQPLTPSLDRSRSRARPPATQSVVAALSEARIAAVCALAFGLAFVSETSLTSMGQDILTRQLQQAGRCVCDLGCA